MSDCIFCKIARGELGALIYEDEKVAAFRDVKPMAKVHILIVPKEHIPCIDECEDGALLGHMLLTARKLAKREGI